LVISTPPENLVDIALDETMSWPVDGSELEIGAIDAGAERRPKNPRCIKPETPSTNDCLSLCCMGRESLKKL
jgi:hypothetical protein